VSNRTIRVNELIQRELNDILRRHYQTESISITVTEVRISTDLRDGKVFVAIIGDEEFVLRRIATAAGARNSHRTGAPDHAEIFAESELLNRRNDTA
jgi:ribosome-binding factor A